MLARFENGYYLEVVVDREDMTYDYEVYDKEKCSVASGWTGYRSMELYYPMNEIDYICEYCNPNYVKGKYEILPYETIEDYLTSLRCKTENKKKKFSIKYFETYSDIYEVEAETYEKACEKLFNSMCNGEVDGPDNCIDSGYECKGESEVD